MSRRQCRHPGSSVDPGRDPDGFGCDDFGCDDAPPKARETRVSMSGDCAGYSLVVLDSAGNGPQGIGAAGLFGPRHPVAVPSANGGMETLPYGGIYNSTSSCTPSQGAPRSEGPNGSSKRGRPARTGPAPAASIQEFVDNLPEQAGYHLPTNFCHRIKFYSVGAGESR